MKVTVVAGADSSIPLHCPGFLLEVSQPHCLKCLYLLRPPPQMPGSW